MSILTPEQFREGRIPSMENFQLALHELEKFRPDPYDNDFGIGIYGSVKTGTHNRASDIDCIVIYQNEVDNLNLSRTIRRINESLNIEVEAVRLYKPYLESGLHSIIPSFGQHVLSQLRLEDRMVFGANPANYLDVDESPEGIREDAKKSLNFRFNKSLRRLDYTNDEERARFLKQIIQEPWHFARLFIQYHNPEFFKRHEGNDTKEVVKREYYRLSNLKFDNMLDKSRNFKKEYLELLTRRVSNQGENGLDTKYLLFLDEVERCYFDYNHFIRGVLETTLS